MITQLPAFTQQDYQEAMISISAWMCGLHKEGPHIDRNQTLHKNKDLIISALRQCAKGCGDGGLLEALEEIQAACRWNAPGKISDVFSNCQTIASNALKLYRTQKGQD